MSNWDDLPEPMGVLDHGYVRLRDGMGTDLTPVNTAKVSFDKRAEEVGKREQGLLKFLGDNNHTSPFRHGILQFEVYAPMFVKNQWYKYLIGHQHDEEAYRDPFFAWNESSRRYVTEEPEFYIPQWRKAPDNKKQGSGGFIEPTEMVVTENTLGQPYGEYRESQLNAVLNNYMDYTIRTGVEKYDWAMDHGVAPEQARVFLPAYAMYIRWIWTGSLQGVLHLIEQRTAPDAQWEFQQYANVVEYFTRLKFPNATSAFLRR